MKPPVIGVGTLNISPRAKALVMEALNNNRLSYGPMMQRLENEFASLHHCRFGIMSNSGTSALQIALQAMKEIHGWDDGDEVIVPAVTFVATANIVLHNGLMPVLVDVDPHYYELDPDQLEAKITPRTRAIIPVHLFGQPADMKPICDIAGRYNLRVIEDSAETMFASYQNRRVGSLGDIGCFSTYVAHILVTGVGGFNTTNDPELAVRMRSLMNHGRDSIYISIDDDKDKSDEELKMIVARRFSFVSVGHSFRVTEMEAALGLAQLEEWESMIAARRANARLLIQKLAHLDGYLQLPKTRPGNEHSFMMFPIVLRDEPKTELVNFLEQNGVETRDMLPLTNQPVYHRLLNWCEEQYPVAKWINQNGFYIASHQGLTEFDLDYMAELFERFFRQRPSAPRAGACLIITAVRPASIEQALEVIPLDLFDRVLAVHRDLSSETKALFEKHGVKLIPSDTLDSLDLVLTGQLEITQENLVFFTADGRHNPGDVGRLLLNLERGNDMVVASRFTVGGERRDLRQMNRYRSVGNRVFSLLANLLFYGNLTDYFSDLRAIKRSKLAALSLPGYTLTRYYRLSIRAVKDAWRVAEIPTVEFLKPEVSTYLQVAASILPALGVLVSEWMNLRK
ncbi:MAG: aminotransferase class I/II-fold pyridoxal phosphate-dependent enzyme [Anaerolineae bacterium]|nr:aminotransferase class I/II-fold pyridoxal phosphate-dependent enzyme [Anaerolineae bacterium]